MSDSAAQQTLDLAWRHQAAGKMTEAEQLYRRVLAVQPDDPNVLHLLGLLIAMRGCPDEGIAMIRRALQVHPSGVEYWYNLGVLLIQLDRVDDAIVAFQKAVELKPQAVDFLEKLGSAFLRARKPSEAVEAYRRALHLRADAPIQSRIAPSASELVAGDNLLALGYEDPANDAKAIFEDHVLWDRVYAAPLATGIPRHDNDPTPDRRLRVGFVSAYLNNRPIGRFLSGLLENHDQEQFEVVCYSDVREPDAMTQRLRKCADIWRDTANASHEQLAELIRRDGIDILIDLGMHAAGNRMLTFARKPAPLQITYLTYCGTTGLQTIDYRISDVSFDPDDSHQAYYSEKTIRLQSFWCYAAPPEAPEVGPLPALGSANAPFTFGSLNDFGKIKPAMLKLWAQLLHNVPNSRLLLYAPNTADAARPLHELVNLGVDPSRVKFAGWVPLDRYFAQYNHIDVALDLFPWGGGTTTCDALWMGVPVVSLTGQTAISRGGLSILSQIGLRELVADTPQEYVRIASDLACSLPRLAELRSSLRQRMRSSRLMDAPAFTLDFESMLRRIWIDWCKSVVQH